MLCYNLLRELVTSFSPLLNDPEGELFPFPDGLLLVGQQDGAGEADGAAGLRADAIKHLEHLCRAEEEKVANFLL